MASPSKSTDAGRFLAAWAASVLAMATPAFAAPPEIRGTWLTTTSSDDLVSRNIAATMQSLRAVGLNTVYVESFKNGYTNFQSPTLAAFLGRTSSLNPFGVNANRDILAETRVAAAEAGLIHGAWFEYGLMAQFGDPSNPLAVKARDNGWLLQDSSGRYTNSSNGFSWMNPLVPEIRSLVQGMAVDAVTRYGVQIIQFDDHLSWPVQFGFDDVTRQAYLRETGRNLPTGSLGHFNSQFVAWRQQKMREFADELVDAIRAARPDVVISLAPSPANFSASNFNAKWTDWLGAGGRFDEVLPQVYRDTASAFNFEWNSTRNATPADRRGDLGSGLRLLGSGAATPWEELRPMLDRLRADAALGHSIWYSEGVSAAGTSNAVNYGPQLAAYYDVTGTGRAPHPLFTTVRWAGAAGDGGSGTWSVLGPTWADRSPIWVQDAVGIFDGPGGTVTVSGSITAGRGLDFRTGGYTVGSGTLHLRGFARGENRLSVAADATVTIASLVTSPEGILKDGGGRLVLSGSTGGITGGIEVAGGTLALAGPATLDRAAWFEVAEGAVLDVSSAGAGASAGRLALEAGQSLSGSGTVVGSVSFGAGSTLSPGGPSGVLPATGVVTVPEPATVVTLAAAAIAMLVARRREGRE
jgi:autotransporter-associated beta strand protein